jgi:hypothetical protein
MRRLAALVFLAALMLGVCAQRADALPGIPSICDLAPSDALKTACELANPGTVVGAVGGLATGGVDAVTGGVASGIFDQALSWMSGVLAGTVKSAMDGLGSALSSAPEPPIGTQWFAAQYAPLLVAGIGMCFFVLIFHLVWNMVRFRTAEMGRCFVMFLAAIFLTATAPLFIQMALQFADALTSAFASVGGQQAGQLTDRITEITGSITQGNLDTIFAPLIVIFVLMVAVILVLVWMVLLAVRAEVLYLGTLAVPFVLPSIIDGKARLARIYFKTMFAVILTKPVLIGTLCFGAMLLRDGYVGGDGLYSIVAGIALIILATVLVFALFKLLLPAAAPVIAVVERGGHHVVEGVRSAGTVALGAVTGGAAGAAMASKHFTLCGTGGLGVVAACVVRPRRSGTALTA